MRKRMLSIWLCLMMVMSILPTVSFAAESDTAPEGGAKIYVDAVKGDDTQTGVGTTAEKAYKTLATAVTAAKSGDTIQLGEGEYSTYGNTSPKKSLTFVGAENGKTEWYIGSPTPDQQLEGTEYNGDYSFDGCENITFQKIKFNVYPSTYKGFIRIDNVVLDECEINGFSTYWGYQTTTFRKTVFNCSSDYALWYYTGHEMTFDGCTFNSKGKMVNAYREGTAETPLVLNFKDCTVNSTAHNKQVLNIKDSTHNYIVNISGNNTVTGVEPNTTTCSRWFQVQSIGKGKSHYATVNIDGTPVWANGEMLTHKYSAGEQDNAFEVTYGEWSKNPNGTKTRTVTKTCDYCGYQENTTENAEADPIEWNVSRSKTATALDTSTWTSNVTLSLPSAEEKLASDVVFVLDKSTSTDLEDQALRMLNKLKEQAKSTEAKVKVGVVIFNKEAHVTPLTDLATDDNTIEKAIKQTISSGTNTHAGLLAGKQMLDEDAEVAANRKYLIFVSDGITYMYNAEPTVTAWSFMADSWKHWAGPDNWKSKYDNNNPPADWSAWMNEIGKKVEAQGTKYEYPYGGEATNCTPEEDTYKDYANSIDKALYLTYQVYQEAQEAGYNCYAVANEVERNYLWGPAFMRYLANGETVNFDKIQNDILYAVSAGSKVEDQMGDAFDFVPGSLKLTVGGKELKSKADDNMTYFGDNAEDLSETNCRFKVLYAPDTDAFVWTINEHVSNFAPVQLTYTVKLTKPETDPGTYGVEDLKGEKDVPSDKALFTNKRAVLNAINSAGATLKPLDFPKPSVSYTVKKSSSGGGGGGGRKPTVTIPDDVPTGLNGDDHFAYIVGYPNGNVEPNGNITRAEVATIFFRLLTEEVRTANSTQSNSLSDVTRGQWFNHAVSTLSSMGIVKGHNDGTFAPNAPITRAEFAAIAARFDDKNTDTSSKFTDIASHWAKNEIGIAANKGWINGYPDGTFRPNQYITRAEAMTLVNRVLNRLPENSSDLLDSMIKWPDNSDASAWYYLAVQEATNSHAYSDKSKDDKYEKWTTIRETRDWTELEK